MPSLKDVRTAIKTTLDNAIDGTSIYARSPASVIEPAVLILPAKADYLIVHRNAGTGWEFDLVVLAPSGDDEVAQDILDDYIDANGAKSIIAAIHASPNLGRTDCSAVVRGMTNYGIKYVVGTSETPYVGATLRLYVAASHQ